MAKRKIAGLRILLTGASSGIGRELALQLAAQQGRVMVRIGSVNWLPMQEIPPSCRGEPETLPTWSFANS